MDPTWLEIPAARDAVIEVSGLREALKLKQISLNGNRIGEASTIEGAVAVIAQQGHRTDVITTIISDPGFIYVTTRKEP